MTEMFVLIYENKETESTIVQYFSALNKMTEYIEGEKLLPDEFTAYQVLKEIKYKLVPA